MLDGVNCAQFRVKTSGKEKWGIIMKTQTSNTQTQKMGKKKKGKHNEKTCIK